MKGPKTPPRARDSGMGVPETDNSPGFIGLFYSLNIRLKQKTQQTFFSRAFSMPRAQHAEAICKGQVVVYWHSIGPKNGFDFWKARCADKN